MNANVMEVSERRTDQSQVSERRTDRSHHEQSDTTGNGPGTDASHELVTSRVLCSERTAPGAPALPRLPAKRPRGRPRKSERVVEAEVLVARTLDPEITREPSPDHVTDEKNTPGQPEQKRSTRKRKMSQKLQMALDVEKSLGKHAVVDVISSAKWDRISKGFQCRQCGEILHRVSAIKGHVETHSAAVSLKAPPLCGDSPARGELTETANSHSVDTRKQKVRTGSAVITETGKPKLSCDFCNKAFYSKSTLQNHKLQHTGEKPHKCPQCGKEFSLKFNMERHFRGHSGLKQFSCDECSKSFTEMKSLVNHRRTHTGERPFKCSTCGKGFATSSGLKAHLPVHHKNYIFACDQCDQKFLRRCHLSFHRRKHTQNPSISCSMCEAKFYRKDDLKVHEETHLKTRPFQCPKCPKRFSWKHILQRHMKCHEEKCEMTVQPKKDMLPMAPLPDDALLPEAQSEPVDSANSQPMTPNKPTDDVSIPSQTFDVDVVSSTTHAHDKAAATKERPATEKGGTAEDSLVTPVIGEGYKCVVCGLVAKSRVNVLIHTRSHTKEKPYQCTLCDKAFAMEGNLKRHIRETHEKKHPYHCTSCEKEFFQKSALKKHVARHHSDSSVAKHGTYKCEKCERTFKFANHLRLHMASHDPVKLNICSVCGRTFNFLCNLRRHMKVHTGDRPHKCPDCGKAFIERRSLANHQRKAHMGMDVAKHNGEPKLYCEFCSKAFYCKSTLEYHRLSHTGEKPHLCTRCGKAFSLKANLKRHIQKHTGEKLFACPDCDKRFTEKKTLVNHQRIHTGERPFKCLACGKGFTQSSTLQSHLPVHVRIYKFSCPACGKRFLRKSHLNFHERKHTQKATMECEVCQATFYRRSDLQRHKQSHLKMKSFECQHCHKRFSRKNTLDEHMNHHTGAKPFHCRKCDMCFQDKSSCRKHFRQAHVLAIAGDATVPQHAPQPRSAAPPYDPDGFRDLALMLRQDGSGDAGAKVTAINQTPMNASAKVPTFAPLLIVNIDPQHLGGRPLTSESLAAIMAGGMTQQIMQAAAKSDIQLPVAVGANNQAAKPCYSIAIGDVKSISPSIDVVSTTQSSAYAVTDSRLGERGTHCQMKSEILPIADSTDVVELGTELASDAPGEVTPTSLESGLGVPQVRCVTSSADLESGVNPVSFVVTPDVGSNLETVVNLETVGSEALGWSAADSGADSDSSGQISRETMSLLQSLLISSPPGILGSVEARTVDPLGIAQSQPGPELIEDISQNTSEPVTPSSEDSQQPELLLANADVADDERAAICDASARDVLRELVLDSADGQVRYVIQDESGLTQHVEIQEIPMSQLDQSCLDPNEQYVVIMNEESE